VVTALPLLATTPPFGWINWSIVILYLAGMITIGHLTGRRKTDAEGYFLGQRSVPIFAVVLSTIAAMLSAATFVGAPERAFNGDLSYLVLNVGGFIAMVLVGTLFIPRFYRAGTITIYGFLKQRYGEGARVACSAMFIVGRILASGARLFIVAIPISKLVFASQTARYAGGYAPKYIVLAILIIGCMGIAYTVAGGIKAVIWTDTAQIIVVIGVALMTIGLLLHWIPRPVGEVYHILAAAPADPAHADGHSKLRIVDTSWDLTREFTLWVALLASMPLQLAAYGTDHDMAQRMLTAKSPLRGGLSAILAQVASIVVVSLFMIIGLLLYIYYKRPDVMGFTPDDPVGVDIYPQFLMHHLPVGISGLAIAGLFAVAQGSLDSAINALASSLVADLYWPLRRLRGLPVDGVSTKAPRVAVLLMGATLILFAIAVSFLFDPNGKRSLLDFALGIMTFASSGMLAVFLTALFTRRGNTRSVLAALVVGFAVVAALQAPVLARWSGWLFKRPVRLASFWAMPIATAFAFVVCIVGRRRQSEIREPSGFEVAGKRA
jgi:SSS family transporter